MGFDACARLVHEGDPDRFLATMTAPAERRGLLFTAYAFNLELARASAITSEPLIAQMRLQFWRDCVAAAGAGETPRAHEVAAPLMDLIHAGDLRETDAARVIDGYALAIEEGFPESDRDLDRFLEETGGALMVLAGRALCPGADAAALRDFGFGAATASLLRALPRLEEQGQRMLVDGRASTLGVRASTALERMRLARPKLRDPRLGPALRTAFLAEPVLKTATRHPERIARGSLLPNEFSRRLRMIRLALGNRF